MYSSFVLSVLTGYITQVPNTVRITDHSNKGGLEVRGLSSNKVLSLTTCKATHPNVVKQQGFFYVEEEEKLKFACVNNYHSCHTLLCCKLWEN